ncbi:MAG: RagB/SusD family nutrient uptake outer membrane protein [Gemmatimonadota bacterium]|nr:RagB/SusD family nutrient uptake outer membrane protein [Gemmatimonadota bacterium]
MKSRYLIMGALVATMTATGCQSSDQLLNVVSPTSVSDEIFWTQESDAVLFTTGMYSSLPSWFDVMGLDGFTDNGSVNRNFDSRYVYTDGTADPQSGYSRGLWVQFYGGVARANLLLANIDRIPAAKIDANRKARYIAETKFLRAVFYLQLTSLFGDVPMPLTPQTDATARTQANVPSAQVYTQIIADLDAAAAVLPASYTGSDVGRATKWAAIAFKARAALYDGRNQVAADAAKQVIDGGAFTLNASYGQLFSYAGENSKEIIFVRTYAKTAQAVGQNNNIFGEFGPPTNSASGHVVPIRNLVDFYQTTDGQSITTSPLYNPAPYPNAGGTMYDNRDSRLAATILYPGAAWDGGTFDSRPTGLSKKPEAINPGNENVSTTGYNIRKYIDLTDKADRGNGGIDFILMRYADVLLMYAEAKQSLGQADATALAALNLVRTRSGMPALASYGQAEVRYERRAELAFEGLRLFDLRRWKIAAAVLPTPAVTGIDYINAAGVNVTATQSASARAFTAPKNYLWPIPQSELDLNPTLKQNPGY